MSAVTRLLALTAALFLGACGGGASMETGVGSGGSGAPVDPLAVGVGTVTGFGSVIVNGERYDERSAAVFVDERPDRIEPATIAAVRLGVHLEFEHRDRVIERATVASELIGPVASVAASGFVVLGQNVRVNADAAHPTAFDGFDALSDLANGAVVEVHGVRAPTGEVLATRVELRPRDAGVRLAGAALAVDGRQFRIGAQPVDASGATVLPPGAAIAPGQRVVVWGETVDGSATLRATAVRVDTPAIGENALVTLDGVVDAFRDRASFRVGGVTVDATSATFSGGTAADLADGRPVRVDGRFTGGTLHATEVELLAATAPPVTTLTGAITDFVEAAAPFRIRESLVRVDAQTTWQVGTAANLANGVQVRVVGPLVAGVVQAQSIELLPLPAAEQRVVAGRIAAPLAVERDGSGTFRLDGTALDVRTTPATVYRNGTPADLAVGRQVSVHGRLDGAVFAAEEVRYLDALATPPLVELDGIAGRVEPASFMVNGQKVVRNAATTYTRDGTSVNAASLQNGESLQVVAFRTAEDLIARSIEIRSPQAAATTVRGLVSGRTPPEATVFLVGSQRVSATPDTKLVPGNRTLADVVNGADVEVQGTIVDGVLHATRIKLR